MAATSFSDDFLMQVPSIDPTRVLQLLNEHFGVRVAQLTPLSGYDDLNFLLDNVEFENEERAECYGHRFVCKFSNAFEARNPKIIGNFKFDIYISFLISFFVRVADSQVKLMRLLATNGIPTADALPTWDGENLALIDAGTSRMIAQNCNLIAILSLIFQR